MERDRKSDMGVIDSPITLIEKQGGIYMHR